MFDQTRASSQSPPLDARIQQAADSGVYTCQVTNPGGRLYREVEVVVEVPLCLTLLPRTTEVTQGERFVVECEAVGVTVPSISWLLNAVELVRRLTEKDYSAGVEGYWYQYFKRVCSMKEMIIHQKWYKMLFLMHKKMPKVMHMKHNRVCSTIEMIIHQKWY
ncbi:hypothetical protein Pcinc_001172 [Petrolisthes cinctipes]|uniref:Ig-like domain-containing protein n=1 Tax=Petrolisthes cinctipes TaxID=88211 RepID=A0AAE1GNF2_PETCI|nr:hypothetical protein Pcinc_001172 [Petrolisthes cinctipes]